MISVEHMQELIDRFNTGELDIRDIIEQSYFGGRADAIDEFAKTIIPYISQYQSAIKHNRFAFIDVNNIAKQLKEKNNEDY